MTKRLAKQTREFPLLLPDTPAGTSKPRGDTLTGLCKCATGLQPASTRRPQTRSVQTQPAGGLGGGRQRAGDSVIFRQTAESTGL